MRFSCNLLLISAEFLSIRTVYPRLLHSYASQVNPFCFKMHTVEQSVAPQNLDRVLREVARKCIGLQLGC